MHDSLDLSLVKSQIFSINTPSKLSVALTTWFFADFMLSIHPFTIIPAIIASGFDGIVIGITCIGRLVLLEIFVFISPSLLREYVV